MAIRALLLAVGMWSVASAQPQAPERPTFARRVVRHFDFEEQLTTPYPVPKFWVRAQDDPTGVRRPGFPAWNRAELDYTMAASGVGSVMLPTSGGSVSLRLDPGVVPVFAGADYLVSARIRTGGLSRAWARVRARYLDAAGRVIPGSETESEPVRSDAWRDVTCMLTGEFESAAFVQVDLELVQPEHVELARLGSHQVWEEDLSGRAWFDDVAIVQMPRVQLSTMAPANIIVAPDRPVLKLSIRDLTGEALDVEYAVQDASGRVVDRLVEPIQNSRARSTWQPAIERYGFYRAMLTVVNGTMPVGATHVDFLYLPGETPGAGSPPSWPGPGPGEVDRQRFGVGLEEPGADVWSLLDDMVIRSGAGSVTLPAWTADVDPKAMPAHLARLSKIMDPLLGAGVQATFSLPRVPDALALEARVLPGAVLPVIARDPGLWMPYLRPIMDRYGQAVRRWQIGPVGDNSAFWESDLSAVLMGAEDALVQLVPGPTVTIPWEADYALSSSSLGSSGHSRAVVMLLRSSAPLSSIRPLADQWRLERAATPAGMAIPELTVAIEPLDRELYGRSAASADLTRRVVELWAAFSADEMPNLLLVTPYRVVAQRPPTIMPDPELAVWHNLSARLSGRRVVGSFQGADGVTCSILAPTRHATRGAALVAWRQAPSPPGPLRAHLSDGPVWVIDEYGNATAVPPRPMVGPDGAPRPGEHEHQIVIGANPVFIEGIDANLVRFMASIRLDPPLVASINLEHEHELVIENPWPRRIEGQLLITEPGGLSSGSTTMERTWDISPRLVPFSIGPGQTQRSSLTISVSPAEESGAKRLVFDAGLLADREYRGLRIETPIALGVRGLELELAYRGVAGGLLVEATVTNTGEQGATLDLSCSTPGLPRERASVSNLAPGASIVRRFTLPRSVEELRGQAIIVSAFDTESRGRVNKSIEVE